MSKIMKVIAVITWIGGFILGISAGIVDVGWYNEFVFMVAVVYWGVAFVSGSLLFSIGVHLENQKELIYIVREMRKELNKEISFNREERDKQKEEARKAEKEAREAKDEKVTSGSDTNKDEQQQKDHWWLK